MRDEDKIAREMGGKVLKRGERVAEMPPERSLLQMGWIEGEDNSFAIGWNSKLIERLRIETPPEHFARMVGGIEVALKHFLLELHGGAQ